MASLEPRTPTECVIEGGLGTKYHRDTVCPGLAAAAAAAATSN